MRLSLVTLSRWRRGAAVRLSVLDQSPIPEGSAGAVALRNSLDLARRPSVGSDGMMLSHYSPFEVAEEFGLR
jgi:hypothetical protein